MTTSSHINPIVEAAAITALNKMLKDGHFSICTIDAVAEMLRVNSRNTEEYRILRTLHCVSYNDMPQILRQELPLLIKKCLGRGPEFQFTDLDKKAIEVKSGWLQKLIR